MKIEQKQKTSNFADSGQIWDLFIFFLAVFTIFSGIVYFFVYKLGGVPVIETSKKFEPAERGVVPAGTFFPKNESNSIEKNMIEFLSSKQVFAATSQKKVFPVPVLETYIQSPIQPNAVLETNSVAFKFTAKNLTQKIPSVARTETGLGFEYMLFPDNKTWQKSSGSSKTFNKLKRGNYIIFVRSVKKYGKSNIVDKTPAWLGFEIKISDYYKKISFSSNFAGTQFVLINQSKEPIDITDWKIKSLREETVIPKAVKFIDPFFTKNETDVVLGSQEKATIKTGRSIFGFNFRPNKCFSFLPKSYRADFSVPGPCSMFSQDEFFAMRREKFFTDKCINFIKSYVCKTPEEKDLKKIETDATCKNFVLENLNYRSCYSNHRSDPNFLSKEWRIYINTEKFNYSKYDTIRILDKNNFLVAEKKIY